MTVGAIARRLRASGAGRRLASRAGSGYIRLLARTVRWRVEGEAHYRGALEGTGGLIVSIWHGRLIMTPTWVVPGRECLAMISANRDGALIADIVGRFGIRAVRGSTYDRAKARDKGGGQAYAEAAAALGRRAVLAITPDGPRGPRMRAQAGVARLAVATGTPVLPYACSARPALVTGGWDRFVVPLPFARGVQVFGAPLVPPEGGDAGAEAAFLAEVEAATVAVTERADRAVGRVPVGPADP